MKGMLKQFWSDIKNVENAAAEDIQKDVLAYLTYQEESKEREAQLRESMERAISVIDIWWNEPEKQAATMRGILSRALSENAQAKPEAEPGVIGGTHD